MRFFFKALLLLPLALSVSQNLRAQDYNIEELTDENATSARPFSISGVERADPGLRLFIATDNPDRVAGLLAAGALLAQISDHQAETETDLPLLFKKAVWCSEASQPLYLAFSDPLPSCSGKPPVRIAHFFEVAVLLGLGRDLAIGQDPDFLWLIEAR